MLPQIGFSTLLALENYAYLPKIDEMYENEWFCYEMDKNGVMSMAENGQIKDKRNEEM